MSKQVEPKPDRQPKLGKQQRAAAKTAASQDGTQTRSNQPSKLDRMTAMLSRPEGASLAELAEATGWQKHSVRGAMAGTLKKKGFAIQSEPAEGGRRYRIGAAG